MGLELVFQLALQKVQLKPWALTRGDELVPQLAVRWALQKLWVQMRGVQMVCHLAQSWALDWVGLKQLGSQSQELKCLPPKWAPLTLMVHMMDNLKECHWATWRACHLALKKVRL